MSLHHGLADLRNNHLTCFTDMMYSSMVPGNLPSQLEILSTGQNFYGTTLHMGLQDLHLLLVSPCITCMRTQNWQGLHCHGLSLAKKNGTDGAIISYKAAPEVPWLQPFQQVFYNTQSRLLVSAAHCLQTSHELLTTGS